MKSTIFTFAGAVIAAVAVTGCGGGGGRAVPASGKKLTTIQATAPLRNARSALAITGLGLKASTRSLTVPMGSWAVVLLRAAKAHTRSQLTGYDQDTQLYFVITNNADGSGVENLYSDSADKVPAGSFVWGVPQWRTGYPFSYPATYTINYSITAGPFAGDHGTLVITLNDALGHSGAIHILNSNKMGENSTCTESVTNNIISAILQISFSDGSSCTGSETWGSDGAIDGTYSFSDGNSEAVNMQPNGSGSEALTAPNGSDQATGDFNSEGNVDIQYDDGTSADVNADTGDTSDSGDDGGDDGDDSGN